MGGGYILGPNLCEDAKAKVPWNENASWDRLICHGLSIEFEFDDQLIVGEYGLSKFDKTSGQFQVFDLNKNYKEAICKAKGVGPSSCASMKDFYFFKCQVLFKGELFDGTEIDKKIEFNGSSAWHFHGGLVEWNYLEMTIISIDDIPKDDGYDSEYQMNESEIESMSESEYENKLKKAKKRRQTLRSAVIKTTSDKKLRFRSYTFRSKKRLKRKTKKSVKRRTLRSKKLR